MTRTNRGQMTRDEHGYFHVDYPTSPSPNPRLSVKTRPGLTRLAWARLMRIVHYPNRKGPLSYVRTRELTANDVHDVPENHQSPIPLPPA